MNWTLPILLSIGTFIGVYLFKQSTLSAAIFSALGAIIIGVFISYVTKDSKSEKQ